MPWKGGVVGKSIVCAEGKSASTTCLPALFKKMVAGSKDFEPLHAGCS